MAAFGSGGGKKGRRRTRDQEMARMLDGVERNTGRCVICYATVTNGARTYEHYAAHARGAEVRKEG